MNGCSELWSPKSMPSGGTRLRSEVMALLGLGGGVVERSAPGLGSRATGPAVRDGPAGTRRQLGQEGLVVTEPWWSEISWKTPWPARLPRHRWPGARRLVPWSPHQAVLRAVQDRPRRREAERPCTEGLFDQLGHLGDLVVGGVLVGTLAEHVGAQGRMGTWVATSIVRGWRPRRRGTQGRTPTAIGSPHGARCPGCPRHLPSTR